MTRQRSPIPLESIRLNLYRGDFARLMDHYRSKSAGAVVRDLVRAHLEALERHTKRPEAHRE